MPALMPRAIAHGIPSPSSGEVAPSYGDGGGKRRGCALKFQIMIWNLLTLRLGLSPSVADYRATKALLAATRPKRPPV